MVQDFVLSKGIFAVLWLIYKSGKKSGNNKLDFFPFSAQEKSNQYFSIIDKKLNLYFEYCKHTVKSEIKAAACISFSRFLVRLIYESGL